MSIVRSATLLAMILGFSICLVSIENCQNKAAPDRQEMTHRKRCMILMMLCLFLHITTEHPGIVIRQ